ncbi:hypothetical protein GGX14DRAFT_647966 [Mycena pura]|uniref:RING-type domain-containing protein n=1 Tax=Mycena pura TaxID=153505 RepID=A0AAD6YDE0_9AGAR|nr:hypothetical protein GGX14DRAFT_647966 [Mycena pura]
MAYRAQNRPSSTYAPAPRQCYGLTSSGQQCTAPGALRLNSQGFCSAHKAQGMWAHPRVARISAADRRVHAESRLCCGVTLKYALCGNKPGGSFRFCHLHGGQHLNDVGSATGPEPPQTSIIRERVRQFHRIRHESQAREYEERERAEQRRRELARERAEQQRRSELARERAERAEQERLQEQQAQRASQEQGLDAPSTPEAAAGPKRRIPGEEDDCPICYDNMNAATEMLTFCEECGNAVHGECFARWKQTSESARRKITCPYCRAEWPNATAARARASGSGTSAWYNLSPWPARRTTL